VAWEAILVKKVEPAWFKLRMPAELHAWLKEQAEQNFRSMSAELLVALTEHRKKVMADKGR
jgi:hypothetical protein